MVKKQKKFGLFSHTPFKIDLNGSNVSTEFIEIQRDIGKLRKRVRDL